MARKTFRFVLFNVFVFAVTTGNTKNDDEIPELRYINPDADPCEDFYAYTCGNFKKEHPLPKGALTIDQFTLLEERITKLASQILESPERDEDPAALKKAKLAYHSCVDLDYIDLEVQPELSVVEEEHGFPLVEKLLRGHVTKFGWNDIADVVSDYGIPMMFNVLPYSNLVDPTKNLIYINPTNMTLPSQIRAYVGSSYEEIIEHGFLETASHMKFQFQSLNATQQLKPFDIYLRKMAQKLQRATNSIIDEQKLLANIDVMANFMKGVFLGGYIPENTKVTRIADESTYTTLKRLNEWTKENFGDSVEIDWVEYMQRVFSKSGIEINEDTQVMSYTSLPNLLYGILNWVNMNDDETVKSFVMMRIYLFMAADGDAESRAILEEYLATQNVEILPRWKYCTRKIIDSVGTASLSFAVAYDYQLHHFNVNGLSEALELIRDLQSTYRENLQNVTWMDDASRAKAIQKLDNMVTIFGYPDFVPNPELLDKFYENLRICGWDNYGNTKRIKAFKNAYQISQVAKRDRTFWDKSPFEVNAYYNRPNNKIIFPIAMLNPVFFGTGNRVLNYGRIGSIIGHEITHGFDSEGRKYDANGTMLPWWTMDTLQAFEKRTDCFINQYNEYYVPEIDAYVDGSRTLNENLADNGGARESYWSMKKMLARKGESGNIAGFTPEQLFFIGFGTAWCSNPSTEYLEAMRNNEHARSKWRVNGVVSNMEEFSEAFKCPAGSKMNPTKKCRLW